MRSPPASVTAASRLMLYRWVAQNIRYGGVPGQWWPGTEQRAEHPRQPLRRLQRSRDDPEGAAGAKGIASSPVLIGAGGDAAGSGAGRFNHAITYIPEFDLYLDCDRPPRGASPAAGETWAPR